MERQEPSSLEVERLRKEIDTLRRKVLKLQAEIDRLRSQHINVWGEP